MFLHVSSNVWESMAANYSKSNTVFAMGIQQPLELIHSFNRLNVMWHVYELFLSSMLYLQKAWSVSTLNTLKANVSFAGQHAQVIWQHAIQVLGEQRTGHFLALIKYRFSTAPGDPTHIFQPLLGSDPFGVSQGHSGSESNEPSLHQILQSVQPAKCLLATERWNPGVRTGLEKNVLNHEDEATWFNTLIVASTDHKPLLLTKTQSSEYDSTSLQNPQLVQVL